MKTLLLNPQTWDLVLDASGNIAVASEPYAIAQDVASALKTFRGECIYDTTRGMPYRESILGLRPPMSLIKAAAVIEAESVPEVVTARAVITAFEGRTVRGQVQFIDAYGQSHGVKF